MATTAYDEIAYPTTAFRQTHPDRLATQLALFGLPYAPVRSCRVLDIGGGDGANLIPLAVAYPEASFVGYDLSEAAIARGQAQIERLGLTNIRLEVQDLTVADYGAGSFDYIIAHGLYAWVPEGVREELLRTIAHHMAPNGAAFVSYNALPGGHSRLAMREMLLFHLRDVEGVTARMLGARTWAAKMLEGYSEHRLFERLMKSELTELLERPLEVLAHDDLGPSYLPAYMHDFLTHAGQHGMTFLTEASLGRCGEGFRPPYALDDDSFDVLAHVQSLDFQGMRGYREDILVHSGPALDRRPKTERLASLYVTSPLRKVEGEPDVYDIGQKRLKIPDEGLRAAVVSIGEAWPGALPVSELRLDDEHTAALLRLYWAGGVELLTEPMPFSVQPPDRPQVNRMARAQAAAGGPKLNTLRHSVIDVLDPVGLAFIASLDGTRTLDEIAADMSAAHGVPVETMKGQVMAKLKELADLSLLSPA